MATNDSRSILYGATYPWTRPMMASLMRHHCKYNTLDAGRLKGNAAACATYTGPTTRFGPKPALVGYECSYTVYVPPHVDGLLSPTPTPSITLRAQLTQDMRYEPAIHGLEQAVFEFCQDHGVTWADRYSLCAVPQLVRWLGLSGRRGLSGLRLVRPGVGQG